MPAQNTTQPPLRHLAIIMDGNGRWARQRGLERIEGHRAGAETVRRVVEVCADLKIEYLTLYAFSTENWARPKAEVNQLMQLLQRFLSERLKDLKKNNIRLTTIGDIRRLPKPVQKQIEKVRTATADHSGGTLVLALNYGAREEILRAVKKTVDAVRQGRIAENEITTEQFSNFLDTEGMPDPDLIIRTSGELRLSNFLMWQAAYTEFWFTDTLWPDFSKEELLQAFDDFSRRKRRFGGIQNK
jgi:undecaprenyl diphosphate synthase